MANIKRWERKERRGEDRGEKKKNEMKERRGVRKEVVEDKIGNGC